jgi:uncharacterized protein YprB with RNaseH-like and TPR domain
MPRPSLREQLRALEARRAPRRTVEPTSEERRGFLPAEERLLPVEGEEVPTADRGAAFVRRRRLPLDHQHGNRTLAEGLGADMGALARAARCPGLAEADLRRAVFFDIETTSLSGGAGIYIFMAGLGLVQDDAFVVEQYFLRDPGEEMAMLGCVRERIVHASCVVTYAGKSFDRPRYRDRLTLCGMPPDFPDERHLDLLHPARRLWGKAASDVRLGTLEARQLGLVRLEDLPGPECPVAYFDYLRGSPGRLPRVFEHNLDDVLSMVTLTEEVARAVRTPREVCEGLGAAAMAVGDGDLAEARRLLEATAAQAAAHHPLRAEVLRQLAKVARRGGDRERAGALWSELAGHAEHAAEALEELAKHHEHHARDLAAARRCTEAALQQLDSLAGSSTRRHRVRERLEGRLARLTRRLGRHGGGAPAG